MDKNETISTPTSQLNMVAWIKNLRFPLNTSQNEDTPAIVKHVPPKIKNARSRVRSFTDMLFVTDIHNMDTIPRSACTGASVFKINLLVFWIL